jgi:hypothetical protein
MVGAEEAPASEDLLADFDLRVPSSPVPPGSDQREPAPLGPFSRTIEHQGSKIRVRSFAACKVEHGPKGGWTEWVRGTDEGVEQPFVVSRRVGRGQVVVIGDTLFATNRHLESPVSMIPENVVFWRWLLTHVTDLEDWVPPPPEGARGGLPEEGAPAAPPAGDATAPPTDSTPAVPDTLPKLPDELPPEDPAADDPASDEVGP